MSLENERLKILEKVAAGELSVGDAADLLSAARSGASARPETPDPDIELETVYKADSGAAAGAPLASKPGAPGPAPTWLRVRINDLETGRSRVSVNIPIRLMKFGFKLGQRFSPELSDLDLDDLTAALASGEQGLLVEVKDADDGEHVQVFVE